MPNWLVVALPMLAFALVLAIPILIVAYAASEPRDKDKRYSQWIELGLTPELSRAAASEQNRRGNDAASAQMSC